MPVDSRENWKKASTAHNVLNGQGWAFTLHDRFNGAHGYVMTDSHLMHNPGYNIAVIFDLPNFSASAYLFIDSPHILKDVPAPAYPPLVIDLPGDKGGRAWANTLQKSLVALKAQHPR